MEFRPLGSSGIHVSCFSLGSWLTYEFMDEQDALAVIRAGIEQGINFLDDARYNDRTGHAPMKTGYSEVLFGRLLRAGGWNRHDLIIANKLWYEFYPQQNAAEELESSLSRLQLDYLDLVYCETQPASLPMIEMVKQLDALIKTGKLRAWGVLNWDITRIEEAHQAAMAEGLTPPCAVQFAYSLLNRFPIEQEETQEVLRAANMSIVASYSLYGGLLSGKYNSEEAIKGRFKRQGMQALHDKGLLNQVNQVIRLAQELGCTPAQLALAYCLKNAQVSSVLFGATKVRQLQENLRALDILPRLNDQVMAKLQNLDN